jgi:hypothetical protein
MPRPFFEHRSISYPLQGASCQPIVVAAEAGEQLDPREELVSTFYHSVEAFIVTSHPVNG